MRSEHNFLFYNEMWLPAAGRFQPGKDTDFGCFSGKGKKRFRKWVARAKRAPKRVFFISVFSE